MHNVAEVGKRMNDRKALSKEDQKVLNSIDIELLRVVKSNEEKMKKLLKAESRIEHLEYRKGRYLEEPSLSNHCVISNDARFMQFLMHQFSNDYN